MDRLAFDGCVGRLQPRRHWRNCSDTYCLLIRHAPSKYADFISAHRDYDAGRAHRHTNPCPYTCAYAEPNVLCIENLNPDDAFGWVDGKTWRGG